jgi:hypothetical protein
MSSSRSLDASVSVASVDGDVPPPAEVGNTYEQTYAERHGVGGSFEAEGELEIGNDPIPYPADPDSS